jgi:hypothetical protein
MRQVVMLGALEAVVSRDHVEQLRVLDDEIVDALDICEGEFMLHATYVKLYELFPTQPWRPSALLVGKEGLDHLNTAGGGGGGGGKSVRGSVRDGGKGLARASRAPCTCEEQNDGPVILSSVGLNLTSANRLQHIPGVWDGGWECERQGETVVVCQRIDERSE